MDWKFLIIGIFIGMMLCVLILIMYLSCHKKDYQFISGKSIWLKDGKNITLVTDRVLIAVDEHMSEVSSQHNFTVTYNLSKGILRWTRW